MNKLFGISFFAFLLYMSAQGNVFPHAWNNPHSLLGVQHSLMKIDTTTKPDLSKIAPETYAPFSYNDTTGSYFGMLKFALTEGKPTVSGIIFRESHSDELSLLVGQITEQGNEYKVSLSTKPASSLFGTDKVYSKATPFSGELIIAQHPARGTMLIPPSTNGVKAQFYEVKANLQNLYKGQWRSSKNDQTWSFNLQPLRQNQLTGTIEVNTSSTNCNYAAYAFPATSGGLWIFTGAWTSNKGNECGHHSWFSDAQTLTLYQTLYPLMAGSEELEINR